MTDGTTPANPSADYARKRIPLLLVEMDKCERDCHGFSWQMLKEELAQLCRLLPPAEIAELERADAMLAQRGKVPA